jgi:hypothetical protein
LEKDNIKENEMNNEVEETEVETSGAEINASTGTDEEIKTNVNKEVESLVAGENTSKESSSRIILANVLDQLLIIAGSCLLLLVCDLILKIFGYMFVRENGSLILAGGIIYFIINCFYAPIMEKSKLENTFARKILNMN